MNKTEKQAADFHGKSAACFDGPREAMLVRHRCPRWALGRRRCLATGRGFSAWQRVGDRHQLDVEDQLCLRRNDRRASGLAVAELIWNEESTLSADLHSIEAQVPA